VGQDWGWLKIGEWLKNGEWLKIPNLEEWLKIGDGSRECNKTLRERTRNK